MLLALMVEVPFLLIRAALPHMYAREFGRVINISSVHGLRASEFKSGYVTAKHALMVGNDERNDIIGANAAGLDAAYFRTEISPANDPAASEHAVCSFTGADYDGLLKFVLNA